MLAILILAVLSRAQSSGTATAQGDVEAEETQCGLEPCQPVTLLQTGFDLDLLVRSVSRTNSSHLEASPFKTEGGNAGARQTQFNVLKQTIDFKSMLPLALPSSADHTLAAGAHTPESWLGPVCAIVIFGIFMYALLWSQTRPDFNSMNQITATVSNAQLFFQHVSYTLILPYSYETALFVGLGAAYSGFLIGTYMTGVMLGSVMMWALLMNLPKLWHRSRRLALVANACNLAGAVIYCSISTSIVHGTPNSSSPTSPEVPMYRVAAFLLISRLVDGFGCGMIVQLAVVNLSHLFKSEERPSQMASNQFAIMMGIGIGPLIGSAACRLAFLHEGAQEQALRANAIAYVGTSIAATFVVAIRFPELRDDMEDAMQAEVPKGPAEVSLLSASHSEEQAGLCLQSKAVLVCTGLVMNALRGFVISGLEAATSLLLEEEFAWRRRDIGVVIGICFLSCIPVKALYENLKGELKLTQWIRVMTFLSIIGTILLFSFACPGGRHCGWVLLLGDAILFPTLFLGDGLSSGLLMMSQHLCPAGSWLDANHIMLYRGLMVAGMGRTLGPPSARMQIDNGGQNSYAFQQFALAVVYLMIFELGMAPRVKLDDKQDQNLAVHPEAHLRQFTP